MSTQIAPAALNDIVIQVPNHHCGKFIVTVEDGKFKCYESLTDEQYIASLNGFLETAKAAGWLVISSEIRGQYSTQEITHV